jgi:hypothetical protein
MTTTIRNAATFYGYGGQHLLDVVRGIAMTLETVDYPKVPQPGNEPEPPTEETEPPLEDDATVQHEAPEE